MRHSFEREPRPLHGRLAATSLQAPHRFGLVPKSKRHPIVESRRAGRMEEDE